MRLKMMLAAAAVLWPTSGHAVLTLIEEQSITTGFVPTEMSEVLSFARYTGTEPLAQVEIELVGELDPFLIFSNDSNEAGEVRGGTIGSAQIPLTSSQSSLTATLENVTDSFPIVAVPIFILLDDIAVGANRSISFNPDVVSDTVVTTLTDQALLDEFLVNDPLFSITSLTSTTVTSSGGNIDSSNETIAAATISVRYFADIVPIPDDTVPVPAALPLFLSGLAGLMAWRRGQKR